MNPAFIRNPFHFRRNFWLSFLALLLLAARVEAQEALRISMAGDLAAAAQRQARQSVGYYNLMWGPVSLRCSAGLTEEYSDNVRYSSDAKADLITRPSLSADVNWPVTEWNTLHLSLDGGYSLYAQHSELNQFFFNPGSGLSFDVYVGDWVINVHDRMTVTENSYDNPGQSGGQSYTYFQNDVGVSGMWDLNQTVLNVGYSHQDFLNFASSFQETNSSSFKQPNSSSETFFLNAGLRLRPEIMFGLESGLNLVSYDQGLYIDTPSTIIGTNSTSIITIKSGDTPYTQAMQWNAGAFTSVQVSDALSARLDGGYSVFTPDSTRIIDTTIITGTNTDFFRKTSQVSGMTGVYFQLAVSHKIDEHINYMLSAGRSMDFSYNGQLYDRLFVRLNPNWNVLRKMTISTPISWENGSQGVNALLTYNRYGAGFTIGRALTQKLTAQFRYQWIMETANVKSYNYTANIVGLNFNYQF